MRKLAIQVLSAVVSLAGPATSIFFCRDKTFVATKHIFCCDKTFVGTKVILVAGPANDIILKSKQKQAKNCESKGYRNV